MPITDESIVIPVPPEKVFDYVDDPANYASFQATNLHAELEGDGPVRVGSRIKGADKILGRTSDWVIEVTEHERPTRSAFRTVEGKINCTSAYTLSPEGDGTRLNYHLETVP